MGMDVEIVAVQQKVAGEWVDISIKGCTGYVGRRSVYSFLEEKLRRIGSTDDTQVYSINLKELEDLKSNLADVNEVMENKLITNSRLALCYHYLTCLVNDSSEFREDPTINERDLRLLIETNC